MNDKSNNKVKVSGFANRPKITEYTTVSGADCWAVTGQGELIHNGDDNLNPIQSCDNHSNCNKSETKATIMAIGKYNEKQDDRSTITIPEDQVESFTRFADKYMVPESNSICKCQQRAMVDILECSDDTAYIDFEYKKIVAKTFDSKGTLKWSTLPIKYCPFCGREL